MSVHDMALVATATERCSYCHHQRGRPCTRRGPHLCRICRGTKHGRFTLRDTASCIRDCTEDGLFAGWQVVLDPLGAVA